MLHNILEYLAERCKHVGAFKERLWGNYTFSCEPGEDVLQIADLAIFNQEK